MRKMIVLAATALFVLAGCGTANTLDPQPVPQVDKVATPPVVSVEDQYLAQLHTNAYLLSIPNANLLATGRAICYDLDTNVPVEIVVSAALSVAENQTQAEAFGYVIGTAVKYLCPQHTSDVAAFLAQNGYGT